MTTNALSLIPEPQSITYAQGDVTFLPIYQFEPNAPFANEIKTFLEQISTAPSVLSSIKEDKNDKNGKATPCKEGATFVQLKKVDDIKADGYTFTIEETCIKICATTNAGAFYGLQTLRQLHLSHIAKGFALPLCTIKDYPQYEWRGLMLDTARNFFSVKFIKKLIDLASLHKLNRFHWHLTDDQGWRLPVPKYPLLTKVGSVRHDPRTQVQDREWKLKPNQFYTHEQIREIVNFAKARHIIIVPEIETPGHASAILASYPELGCAGKGYAVEGRFGIFDDVLCAGNDKVLEVLDAVFETVAELFPGPYIHIGGDECPHVKWETCPKCQKRLKENNLQNAKELQSWMTCKVANLVAKHGKTPIGWDEVIDNADKVTLPKNLIVMSWRGEEGGAKAANLGHKAIMSPTTAGCYLDYPHLQDDEEPGLQSCTTVQKSYEYSPVPQNFSKDKVDFILGGQGNVWTELLSSSRWVEYMVFPRLCALAEALWLEPCKKDMASFAKRLDLHKTRLDALDVLYYKGALS